MDFLNTIVAGFGVVLMLAGTIVLLIQAFTEHLVWGIACVLIGPLLLVFSVLYWPDTRTPLLMLVGGTALLALWGWAVG